MDTSAVDHVLSTTRAVRRRLDLNRPVEPEVLLECLRLAQQAPTASNSQTWRFLIVTDPLKRARLGELYREGGSEYLAQGASRVQDEQTRRVHESALYLASVLERVPVHVIPCVKGRFEGAPNAVAAAGYASIIPAAWSFMLALRSRGLGSAWTTLHLLKEKEAAALLGIPDDITQVALLPVAYTIGAEFRPAARPPVETVTYWNTWGGTGADG